MVILCIIQAYFGTFCWSTKLWIYGLYSSWKVLILRTSLLTVLQMMYLTGKCTQSTSNVPHTITTWKAKVSITFSPLHSSTNQELLKKHLCNEEASIKMQMNSVTVYAKEAITCQHLLLSAKINWTERRDNGKPIKKALYVPLRLKECQTAKKNSPHFT